MKRRITILSILLVLAVVLSACGGTATTEAPAETTAAPTEPTEEPTEATEAPTEATEAPEETGEVVAGDVVLPRNETMYFNGQQWGSVVCWNPYSSSCNNAMTIAQQDNARVLMFETPYLYNMLDGQVYPLLADGDFAWDEGRTQITFKIKEAAHWSDGTPVTAEDVAYTWATHVKYNTATGAANQAYIEDIVAEDPQTVVIKAVLGEDGKALNPLLVQSYLSSNYVIQKAWTQKLEARVGEDSGALLTDAAEDVVWSGPYHKFYADDTKVVLIRDDNYWGQDASMWGKLPIPKYLGHMIYKDNDAGTTAFKAGEVDVSQQKS